MQRVVLLAVLGTSCRWLWWTRRRRQTFAGLDSQASYSSCIIAACRAKESAKADGLIYDPLAERLAGPLAMSAIQRLPGMVQENTAELAAAETISAVHVSAMEGTPPPKRLVQRIIMRTMFFDHVICEAVGQRGSRADCLSSLQQHIDAAGKPCAQVVLLGAGMDTRPWRLAMPAGVQWFEVDRADVLRHKRRMLVAAGADLTHRGPSGLSQDSPGAANSPAACTAPPTHFPLHAARWSTVVADLQQPGWTQRLVKAGFDPRVPTVFVLEGLLYYMETLSVPTMLLEAAGVSAPGSVLAASIVSEEMVASIKARPTLSKDSIMHSWKWGCPPDAAQYFGSNGWEMLSLTSWADAAAGYNLQPVLLPGQRSGQQASGYIITRVAA